MKTNSKKVIGFLKELFFPTATCYLCGSELDGTGECLCESCESGLKKIPDYERKYKGLTVYSYAYYDELSKEIVLQCKDNNKSYFAEIEARYIKKVIDNKNIDFDAIVYVPASSANVKRRGYDHMKEIAKILSEKTGKPIAENLDRNKENIDQTEVRENERLNNVLKSFRACGDLYEKRVLLIDDVVTTGATLIACEKALAEIEPKEIIPVTFVAARPKR